MQTFQIIFELEINLLCFFFVKPLSQRDICIIDIKSCVMRAGNAPRAFTETAAVYVLFTLA